jgi:hypothetical protein
MKLESRPSSEQGLASAANLSGPLITSSPIDIQFPNDHATDDLTLPDACPDGFTAPGDLAREADINGYKSGCHFFCQRFARTSQTVWSNRKNFSNVALPGMSSA